ncbi:MAG: DUF4838 domain-containing protein [Cyclobacteriaceae bacterium]
MKRQRGSTYVKFGIVVLIATYLSSCNQNPATTIILEQGKTYYSISIPEFATPYELYAAELLQNTILESTGVGLDIGFSTESVRKQIYIGGSQLTDSNLVQRIGQLNNDEFIIHNSKDFIVLAGGGTRGTIYAVVEFLSRYMGCRWYTPESRLIPTLKRITLEMTSETYTPSFDYRDVHYISSFDDQWAVLNKVTPVKNDIPDSLGGSIRIRPHSHSFFRFIPPRVYFESYPEYFALINGRRDWRNGQLCLTNQSMKSEFVKYVDQFIIENPNTDLIALDQEDLHKWCTCDNCAKRNPSDNLHNFIGDVIDEVSHSYPKQRFTTLAYLDTEIPTTLDSINSNLTIRLCRMGYCDAHAVDQCRHLQHFIKKSQIDFVNNINLWSELTDNLIIWDYYTDFSHYLMPYPNHLSWTGNVKYYHSVGAIGVFAQGPGKDYDQFSELKAWVLAQLMWDISQDPDDLIEEFIGHYYGEASEYILDYYKLLNELMDYSDAYLIPYSGSSYLTNEFLLEGEQLLNRAAQEVNDSYTVLKRIDKVRLCHEYAQIVRSKEDIPIKNFSQYTLSNIAESFITNCQSAGIRRFRERRGEITSFFESLRPKRPF